MKTINLKSIFLKLWPFFFITAFVFIFHYEAITTKDSIYFTPDPFGSDYAKYVYPWRMMYSRCLHEQHEIPFWTAKLFCGYPIFSSSDGGFFSPINLLFFSVFPINKAFNYYPIFTLWLAAIGMYVLSRKYGMDMSAALLAGIIWSHGAFFIRTIYAIQVLSILPWMLICVEVYFEQRKISWLLLGGVLSGLQWLIGYPPYAYISIICVSLIIISHYIQNSNRRAWWKGLPLICTIPVVGLGVAAIQIIPLLELVKFTVRSGGISYNYASFWHYPWKYLITFIFPFYYGDIVDATSNFSTGVFFLENCAYIGLVPLILALLALLIGWRDKNIRLFNVLLLLSLLVVIETPLYKLAWKFIPGMHYLRKSMIFLSLTTLSLAMLAGFSMVKINSLLPKRYLRYLFTFLVFVISCVDLYSFGYARNPLYSTEKWYKPPNSMQVIKGNTNLFRVYSFPQGWSHLYTYLYWRNKGFHNLDLFLPIREFLPSGGEFFWAHNNATGYVGELYFNRHSQIEQMFSIMDTTKGRVITANASKFLTMMSVKYIVVPWDIFSSQWELVYKKPTGPYLPDVRIYENKKFLPRAYVVGRIKPSAPVFSFSNIVDEEWDPHKEVWLEEGKPAEEFPVPDIANADSNVLWASSNDKRVELDVNMKAPGYLVLTDTWYPGWQATVDGKFAKIYKANYIFRAVWIDTPGAHRVTFWYNPLSLKIGASISIITLLGLGMHFGILTLNNLHIIRKA